MPLSINYTGQSKILSYNKLNRYISLSRLDGISTENFIYYNKSKVGFSLKNELISRIIKSNEMKFIILVAVFVDIKLVEQIFKDKKSLFICAFGLNVLTLQELKDIKKMLKLDEEKPNIDNIPKKYKLVLNEDKI